MRAKAPGGIEPRTCPSNFQGARLEGGCWGRGHLINKTFIYWFYALVKVFFKAPSENRTRISWMEARNNNHYTTGAYNLFIPQKPSTVNCKIHSQFRKTLEKF